MPRRVIFDREARLEFKDAVAWYNERETKLGDRFEVEVHAAFQRILQDPERFQRISRTIHKAGVDVFDKYNIYFRIEPDFIGVVSVFHVARNPAELRRRLK
jgi:plasmid stabilization system protein ParE